MANKARELVMAGIDAAVNVSGAEVERFIGAARRRRASMTAAELITALERSYTGLVATTGAAAGGVAAAPGVGLPGGVAAGIADAGAFTVASAVPPTHLRVHSRVQSAPVDALLECRCRCVRSGHVVGGQELEQGGGGLSAPGSRWVAGAFRGAPRSARASSAALHVRSGERGSSASFHRAAAA